MAKDEYMEVSMDFHGTNYVASYIIWYSYGKSYLKVEFRKEESYNSLSSDIYQAKYHVCETIMRYVLTDHQIKE